MTQTNTNTDWFHDPVLKKEILSSLVSDKIKTMFDGTTGLGGHAEAILEAFPSIEKYIACDLDAEHLKFAKERLNKWIDKLDTHNCNFAEIKEITQKIEYNSPLAILLDLGICSTHVDDPEKGFCYAEDAELKMCFDQTNSTKCLYILSNYDRLSLTDIFLKYGEEPLAKKIARRIIEARKLKPIKTSFELVEIIEGCTFPQNRKKTLTRIFQALRIEVNDEINILQKTIEDAFEIMRSGDRLGIISYHSLEDRVVKKFFKKQSKAKTIETDFSLHTEVAPADFKLLTKKPITPGEEELEQNRRARSAKLRIIQKI